MGEIVPQPTRTRIPEFIIVAAALLLLGALEAHEGYFQCVGKKGPGPKQIQSAWVLLLCTYVSLAISLMRGSRIGWWVALLFVSFIAYFHIKFTHHLIQERFWPAKHSLIPDGSEYVDSDPPRKLIDVWWMIIRNALLLLVPGLLLLGRIREYLRDQSPPSQIGA